MLMSCERSDSCFHNPVESDESGVALEWSDMNKNISSFRG